MTRIINPPPPVEKRPRCPACNKPRQPQMKVEYERSGGYETLRIANKTWGGGYHGYGVFCTLRCCERYANTEFKRTGKRYHVT